MNGLAFCFPGQGSQRTDMFAAYAGLPEVAATLAEAAAVLGEDLAGVVADQETLNHTTNTQPLMLAAGVGVYRAWLAAGGDEPVLLAGHSLGEYSALVVAGSLEFTAAVQLVRQRALAMQAAVAENVGAMCAILGLEEDQVAGACAATGGKVWVANLNAPGQVVIAGSKDSVMFAATACKNAGAKRAMQLPVSVPSHCPLMQPVTKILAKELDKHAIGDAVIPVVQNATGKPTTDAAAIKANLVSQLVCPVDWVGCARLLGEVGQVIECGPTKVLHGLNRRIIEPRNCAALDGAAALSELLS